jgi:cysteine desulfurase / selenocysteine lyase
MQNIHTQFPVLANNKDLAYFDSASSSLTPKSVIDSLNEYYTEYPVNIHRGLYELSATATKKYEDVRKSAANFINANVFEIIFTSGTTQSINMIADMLASKIGAGDNIVIPVSEHHANMLPWQKIAKNMGAELRYIKITSNYQIDIADAKKLIDKNTKILAFASVSNVLGTQAPTKELVELAKSVGAFTIIDAAQSAGHEEINVKEIGCDFLAFSGHKMYGPTGVGVLYIKQDLHNELTPTVVGGGAVSEVSKAGAEYLESPYSFEAGTPNIGGVIGLGAAIAFLKNTDFREIQKREEELSSNLIEELNDIDGLHVHGSGNVISFWIDGVHPHDIADILASKNVAVRAGHHCAMPLMKELNVDGLTRISIGLYNTVENVNQLKSALRKVKQIFG